MSKQRKTAIPARPIQRKHAAVIDIGATSIYVAVPLDRDPQPVRLFQTFTEDLHQSFVEHMPVCGVPAPCAGITDGSPRYKQTPPWRELLRMNPIARFGQDSSGSQTPISTGPLFALAKYGMATMDALSFSGLDSPAK